MVLLPFFLEVDTCLKFVFFSPFFLKVVGGVLFFVGGVVFAEWFFDLLFFYKFTRFF
jgi:hypothetical protein